MRAIELSLPGRAKRARDLFMPWEPHAPSAALIASDARILPYYLLMFVPTLTFVCFVGVALSIASGLGYMVYAVAGVLFATACAVLFLYARCHFRHVVIFPSRIFLCISPTFRTLKESDFIEYPFDSSTVTARGKLSARIRLGTEEWIVAEGLNFEIRPTVSS